MFIFKIIKKKMGDMIFECVIVIFFLNFGVHLNGTLFKNELRTN